MSKKGFTLVELIGVLVLLSVIVLVAFPNILNTIKKTDSQINEATEALLVSNARSYVNDTMPTDRCVTVSTLVKEGYTQTPIASVDEEKSETVVSKWAVKFSYTDGKYTNFTISETGC